MYIHTMMINCPCRVALPLDSCCPCIQVLVPYYCQESMSLATSLLCKIMNHWVLRSRKSAECHRQWETGRPSMLNSEKWDAVHKCISKLILPNINKFVAHVVAWRPALICIQRSSSCPRVPQNSSYTYGWSYYPFRGGIHLWPTFYHTHFSNFLTWAFKSTLVALEYLKFIMHLQLVILSI